MRNAKLVALISVLPFIAIAVSILALDVIFHDDINEGDAHDCLCIICDDGDCECGTLANKPPYCEVSE